jgi:hypothetical protein
VYVLGWASTRYLKSSITNHTLAIGQVFDHFFEWNDRISGGNTKSGFLSEQLMGAETLRFAHNRPLNKLLKKLCFMVNALYTTDPDAEDGAPHGSLNQKDFLGEFEKALASADWPSPAEDEWRDRLASAPVPIPPMRPKASLERPRTEPLQGSKPMDGKLEKRKRQKGEEIFSHLTWRRPLMMSIRIVELPEEAPTSKRTTGSTTKQTQHSLPGQ